MESFQADLLSFQEIYFDEACDAMMEEASEIACEYDGELSQEEYKEMFYDVECYPGELFIDLDFLAIDSLYNSRRLGDTSLEEITEINMDYYFDLLPMDIQEQYKTGHLTLTGEVSDMLGYINERISHGDLYKLFWDGGKPVKEERIQLILENIMDAYFHNKDIEITREAMLGNGKVDFKLYRSSSEDEKILIEVKRASSSYLKKGYEKQLTDYMKPSKYKNAFYIIVCFTDSEYERAVKFIRENVYTDFVQLYINIFIMDVRQRKSASVM